MLGNSQVMAGVCSRRTRSRNHHAVATVVPRDTAGRFMLQMLNSAPSLKLIGFVITPLVLGSIMLMNGFRQFRVSPSSVQK
mmetsp:Transcript_36860/g.147302  ORF Transcript_36860/g.147302 Transcript_36860/m.147302 type:complete len:81 (-) Transcript_36860:230-472(-)